MPPVASPQVLLFANKIKEIPAGLTKLAKLETLNVFNNQIKKLPLDIGKVTRRTHPAAVRSLVCRPHHLPNP